MVTAEIVAGAGPIERYRTRYTSQTTNQDSDPNHPPATSDNASTAYAQTRGAVRMGAWSGLAQDKDDLLDGWSGSSLRRGVAVALIAAAVQLHLVGVCAERPIRRA
jgi:hypothetical protein